MCKFIYGLWEVSVIVGWLCFFLLIIMFMRCVYDLGYSGYFVWIVVFCVFFVMIFVDVLVFFVVFVLIVLGFVMVILVGIFVVIVLILVLIIIFFWGFFLLESGENEYGFNFNEVLK